MRIFISFYLLTFLVFPIVILFSTSIGTFYDTFWAKATTPVALCTYQLSFSLSFIACLINTFFGFLVAWILVRYNFVRPVLDEKPNPIRVYKSSNFNLHSKGH